MPRKRKYQTSSQKNGAKVKQLKLQFKVDRPLIEKGIRSVISVLALSVLAGEADGHNHEELEEQLNVVEEEVLADPLFEQGILCVDFCVGVQISLCRSSWVHVLGCPDDMCADSSCQRTPAHHGEPTPDAG